MSPYTLVLCSNLTFVVAGQFFTYFARKISPSWMNAFKAFVASIAFFITITLLGEWKLVDRFSLIMFLFSGVFALGLGDLLLLKAFSDLGPGRTLMIFGVQPLIIAFLSNIFLNQAVPLDKFWAILFFIACSLTIALESIRTSKNSSKGSVGILIGLAAVLLDAIGIITSRMGYDRDPLITGMEGAFYRTIGALFFYLIFTRFVRINFIGNFLKLKNTDKIWVILAPLLGTFLSMIFYFSAVKKGHLASLSAVAITGVVFANLLECFWFKRRPSIYLLAAIGFFTIGILIIF